MGVLRFHSDKLWYLHTTEGYYDENGDYNEGKSEWVEYGFCDAVPVSGTANIIFQEDGTKESYSYTIYLSPMCRQFRVGDKVRVFLEGEGQRTFVVKGFHRYQLQCKMFV